MTCRERVRECGIRHARSAITVDPVWHDPADNGRGSTVTVDRDLHLPSLVPIVPLPPINVTAESSLVVNN